MAESTLSLTYQDLQAEVGFFLGFGRGTNFSDSAWTTRQQSAIDNAVKTGIRMFYYPSALPGDSAAYDWSFMRPTRDVALAEGDSTCELPADFDGIEGDVQIVGSERIICAIKHTNEQRVNSLLAQFPTVTGQPMYCAIRQETGTALARGQRSTLILYPTADQDYTLQIQYYILPDALTTQFPYALGGSTHAETIKAACLAAAELDQNYERGVRYEQFIERMRASVSLDRRNKAQTFGYNRDSGYNRQRYTGRWFGNTELPITWSGVDPDA